MGCPVPGQPRLVSAKSTAVRPVAAARTGYGPPTVPLAIKGAEATPARPVNTMIVEQDERVETLQ
jgi:hypothetical protein